MRKFYVISTDPLSDDNERKFQALLEEKQVGWWHWLPNFWLVMDSRDVISEVMIRDKIHEIDTAKRAVVMRVTPEVWTALTRPDAQGRPMEKWLNENWVKT